jgi:DNA-directed RNA polymerase subunit N (RpoN/RPB10)
MGFVSSCISRARRAELCRRRAQTIGHMWQKYFQLIEEFNGDEESSNEKKEESSNAEVEAFEHLGLTRYCCRRMLLTHVDLVEKLMVYNPLASAEEVQN